MGKTRPSGKTTSGMKVPRASERDSNVFYGVYEGPTALLVVRPISESGGNVSPDQRPGERIFPPGCTPNRSNLHHYHHHHPASFPYDPALMGDAPKHEIREKCSEPTRSPTPTPFPSKAK
ncbi:hypothetical protein ZHAS_00009595 [Anopheles sinensis]|uniref:Uncharacterized protein n=1 Tax=Anopheles sinensis TaxID=74873 RepID=A0A084VVM2_ANOSI|nr:hypothetical protein ZHAS_00009595 [Anopheles sinensis]